MISNTSHFNICLSRLRGMEVTMNQRRNRWGGHLALWLTLTVMLTLPLIHIYAAEATSSVAQENQEARFSAEAELNALVMAYQAMESNPNSERWVGVERAITVYGNSKLTALVSDGRYQTDPLVEEIRRYQAMGTVAGEVAWIYYTHVVDLPTEGQSVVAEAYEAILGDIDAVTLLSQTELTRTYLKGGFCARMYVAVYDAKLDALLLDGDSEAVKGQVAAAKENIRADACVPVTVEGQVCTSNEQYQAVYEAAAEIVAVQRKQEQAIGQLTDVFAVLHPDVSIDEHPYMVEVVAALDADDTVTVAAMNERLRQAFDYLLDEFGAREGGYTDAYFATMRTAVAAKVAEADAADSVAVLLPVVDGFAMNYIRASAKDGLVAYAAERGLSDDAEAQALLERYNGSGSIIDLCMTPEAVAYETLRAGLLMDLRVEYLYAEEMITVYYEGTAADASIDKIKGEYDKTVILISSNHPQPPTEEVCLAYYLDCVAVFNDETAEAEVTAFRRNHGAILDKPTASLTRDDAVALQAAMAALAALNPIAKDKLSAEDVMNLADKWQVMAVMAVADILPSETPRGAYASALTAQINGERLSGTHPDDLLALAEAVDGHVMKAEGIATLYERYENICAEEAYAGYAAADKDTLRALTETTAGAMVNATADEAGGTVADALTRMTAESVMALNRAEAYARLHAKAAERKDQTEATDKAVQEILQAAKEAIAAADDEATVRSLTDAAMLDMARAYAIQDVTAKAEAAKASIAAMGFLTTVERETWAEAVASRHQYMTEAMRAADEAALTALTSEFNQATDDIVGEADAANTAAGAEQKAAARQKVATAHAEIKAYIEGRIYLSSEDKAAMIARADALVATANRQIDKATSTAAHLAAESALTNGLNDLKKEVDASESAAEQACRTQATTAVTQAYDGLITAIQGMTYLSDAERADCHQCAEDIRSTFDREMAEASTPAAIAAARAKAQAATDDLYADAHKTNVTTAKSVTVTLLMSRRDELVALVDNQKHLDDDARKTLKNRAEELFAEARRALEDAADEAAVHDIKHCAEAAMEAHAATVQAEDDASLVSHMTPVAVVLACLLIAEIAAAAVLWAVRRRRLPVVHTAAFLPVTARSTAGGIAALGMTPVAMWATVWVLALADAVLAAVIAWLIVEIVRLRVIVHRDVDGVRVLEEPRRRRDRLPEPDAVARLDGPKLICLTPPTAAMPELRASVTVEEADELISDEDALCSVELDIEDTEVYRGHKKAEINIDVIARYFAAGETVTLNSLKKKGLLPHAVGHVKVLARGRLDKPLTVMAQGFSASAVKMIVLTGGKAILTEGAPERWTRRRKGRK